LEAAARPRSLVQIADSPELTPFEANLLATALLRWMGVEAEFLGARVDGEETAICAWRHGDKLYGLPIWPAKSVVVQGARVEAWSDSTDESSPPSVGWEILRAYGTIAKRTLPFALTESLPADGTDGEPEPPVAQEPVGRRASSPRSAPLCPACDGPMARRSGRFGEFWGCTGYPDCRGTRQVTEPSPRRS
jgi:hypothetical protein